MFHKNILPAEEELGGVAYMIGFSVLWILVVIYIALHGGGSILLLPFVAAGLFLGYSNVQKVRRVCYYRRLRREAVSGGHRETGRIVNIIRRSERVETSERSYMKHLYYLVIEVTNPLNGAAYQFESEAYSIPVDKYLASPVVSIYTGQGGWKRYIEDFQYKTHKNEPSIFPDRPEFHESVTIQRVFPFIMLIVMAIVLLYQFLGR